MAPAEAEEHPQEARTAEVSPTKAEERNFWSDSDYSTDTSYRSSSAGETAAEGSPAAASSRSSRPRMTPNPLLQAFPIKSDEASAVPAADVKYLGHVIARDDSIQTSQQKGKKAI